MRSVVLRPLVPLTPGVRFTWAFPGASGTFEDARLFEVEVEYSCPSCGACAVCALPEPALAKQPDDTTHVCHPSLGGCNQGFAREKAS